MPTTASSCKSRPRRAPPGIQTWLSGVANCMRCVLVAMRRKFSLSYLAVILFRYTGLRPLRRPAPTSLLHFYGQSHDYYKALDLDFVIGVTRADFRRYYRPFPTVPRAAAPRHGANPPDPQHRRPEYGQRLSCR